MTETIAKRKVDGTKYPRYLDGYLLVGDLDGGLSVLCLETHELTPVLVRNEDNEYLMRPGTHKVYSVDGFDGATPERAMRAFVEGA